MYIVDKDVLIMTLHLIRTKILCSMDMDLIERREKELCSTA